MGKVEEFKKDDYIEGIETVGIEGYDLRDRKVRGWVNDVYCNHIDIQADDSFNGARGTLVKISTAVKIYPQKPRPARSNI